MKMSLPFTVTAFLCITPAAADETVLDELIREFEPVQLQDPQPRLQLAVPDDDTAAMRIAQNGNPTRNPTGDPLDPVGLRQSPLNLGGQVASGTAFNPAFSIIIDSLYYNDNVDGEAFEIIEAADGFGAGHAHDHDDDHGHGAFDRGFNLKEVEFVFTATVDPYFDALVLLNISNNELDVEEAYITTRSLPAGLQIQAGRFLSDIGYINKQHPHDWNFTDRTLVNQLLFGDHGLQETGVQLRWLAPTDQYLLFGAEALQGESAGIAGYLGEQAPIAGTERILGDAAGPRLFTAFTKFAPDFGFDHALQTGLSLGYTRRYQFTEEHSTRFEDHDGSARFYGADFVYKYTPGGRAYGHGNVQLLGEYYYRERDVDRRDVQFGDDVPLVIGDVSNVESFTEKQDGYYLEGLYGFAPRWNGGLRVEQVGLTNETGRGGGAEWDDSRRYSAVLNFMPTEFSRLRLQYTRGDFAHDGERERFNQVFLQYQMSLGVHGAHAF